MKKGLSYTIGSVVILIICIVAFVLPGTMGSGAQGNMDGIVFGKYDQKKINYTGAGISDFDQALTNFYNMIQSQAGQIGPEDQIYLFNYAFNSTVMKYAHQSYVEKAGYQAPKDSITRTIKSYFSDSEGNFNAEYFNSIPEDQIEELVKSVSDDLTEGRFYRDTFGSDLEVLGENELFGVKHTDKEIAFLKDFSKEKRGFRMAAFNKMDYPTEEKVSFGKKNAAKFNKYEMSVITVEDESLAKTVLTRLNNSEITFEDAITEYSDKNYSDSDGNLTNAFQYQIEKLLSNPEDLSKIIDLAVDATSSIVKTNTGYSIFKMKAAKIEPDFESDEIISRVSSYINTYETSIIEDYFVTKAKDFSSIASNIDFETACEKANIENIIIPPFPLNYGSISIAQSLDSSLTGLAGANEDENFLKTAFSLNMNEISEPIILNDHVIILQYYTNEDGREDKDSDLIANQLDTFDEDAYSNSIMSSPLLENNFQSVYFNELLNY